MTIKKELIELIKNLKKGQTLHYWYDIADKFDKKEIDKIVNKKRIKGEDIDYNIVDEYEKILDDLEDKGIIKYKKDEDGCDNIIVKL